MAIRREYYAPASAVGPIAVETGRGALLRQLQDQLRQQDLAYAQLDEGGRRYDLGLAADQQNQSLNRQLGYDQLGQRADQFQQGLQADIYARELGIQGQLAAQDLQNQGYNQYQQQATQRALMGYEAQAARAREKQTFDKNMADRDAVLAMMKDGKLTPRAEQQAKEIWEQQTGMPWGLPDDLAAQSANAEMQNRTIPAMRSRLGPLSPQVSDDELSTFIMPDGNVDWQSFGDFVADKQEWEKIDISRQKAEATGSAHTPDALLQKKQTDYQIEQQVKAPEIRHQYDASVQQAMAKATARYHQLLKEAATAATSAANSGVPTGGAKKVVSPDQLPADVKQRLKMQAYAENPKPIPPPGYVP